ncbi:MAG: hypothetical protein ACOYKE_14140, partial [Ferruginibacter sp.]
MKTRISALSKILLIVSGTALIAVLFLPIWRIELDAPQYPEGLKLQIYANDIKGDVDIINGLNHYIGMRTLHRQDFFEFTILPYCIIFFSLFFIFTAIINHRKWLNILLITFLLFGIIAMVDFWRWEYNYGHNLNPNAAIVVPGMAYQPPLIGFKQLLNFGAYSIPDFGGWIFVGAGILLLFTVIVEWKRNKHLQQPISSGVLLFVIFLFTVQGCTQKPMPIKMGTDNCAYCKMTISDLRFGGVCMTATGKQYVFDDIICLKHFLQQKKAVENEGKIYVVDYAANHLLLPLSSVQILW